MAGPGHERAVSRTACWRPAACPWAEPSTPDPRSIRPALAFDPLGGERAPVSAPGCSFDCGRSLRTVRRGRMAATGCRRSRRGTRVATPAGHQPARRGSGRDRTWRSVRPVMEARSPLALLTSPPSVTPHKGRCAQSPCGARPAVGAGRSSSRRAPHPHSEKGHPQCHTLPSLP